MGRAVCIVAAAGSTVVGSVVLLTVAAAGTTIRWTVVLFSTAAALAFASASLGCACPFKFCFEVNKSTRQQVNEAMRREGEPPLPTRWEGMLNLCYDSWI